MAIFGRPEFLPQQQRDSIYELAGVRGFDGEFEKSLYVKGVEAKEVAPGSAAFLMLESARVQQQVARARGDHWAMVHAMGFGPMGAFVVVDFFPKSAAELIKSGRPIDGRGLYRVMMGTLRGLRDMQQVMGRPHGNLKTSNILLSSDDPREAQVALSDPAPPQAVASGQIRNDLFALGQIIHQLVLHQPFAGAWPVAPTRAWSELGRKGRRWRNLCNRLLNPNPEKRPRKLAWVYRRVIKLRPKKNLLLRPMTMVILLLALGALALVQRDRILPWMKSHVPQRQIAATNPTEPAPAAPKQMVILAPTTTAPTTRNVETLAGESAFLSEYQALYEKRGWNAPAQYLANLRARFMTTPATDSAARKAMADTEAMLKKIEAKWLEIGGTSNEIAKLAQNDPVLLTYPQFVRQTIYGVISRPTSTSPLPGLLEMLERAAADPQWGAVLAYLKSGDANKLDHPWLIESSPLHKRFGNKPVASSDDLAAWLAEARSPEFSKLAASDDPRPRWSARQQISRIRANDLSKLEGMYKDASEGKKAAAGFAQNLDELDKSATGVLGSGLPWSVKNRPGITSSIGEVDQKLAQVSEQIRGAMAKRQGELDELAQREAAMARQKQDADNFVAKVAGMRVSTNPAVQKEFAEQVKGVVEEVRADPGKFGAGQAQKVADIQARLAAVNEAIGALPQKLEVAAGNAEWNQRLIAALGSLDARQREMAEEKLLEASRGDDFKTRATEIRKNYDQWADAAGKMVADLNEVDRLLAAGYSLDEAPARDRASARQILDRWQKQDFFGSDLVQGAIAPLLRPINELSKADTAGLVKFAGSGEQKLGLRLTAWRGLVEGGSDWPTSREDLKQAMEMSQSLVEAVGKVAPAERRELQLSELNRSTGKAWTKFLAKAANPEDIEFAMAMREKLNVAPDQLDGRARFNMALYEARHGTMKGEKLASELQGAIEGLPGNLRTSPEIARLASAIRQSKLTAARTDFSLLGPMAARARAGSPIKWNFTFDDGASTVTYTAVGIPKEITQDDLKIVFKRVETESGDVYLSTSEVSVGLFADVISASDKWREVVPMLWNYVPNSREGDPRPGPRSWEWFRYGRMTQGIHKSLVWLTSGLAGTTDHYPPSLATAENRMVLKDENGELNPSKRQPMNYVSPEAAIYFSQMLACRLPTSGEWKAAYRAYAKDAWNLRDRTFGMLMRWIPGAQKRPPDLGIFMAEGEKVTAEVWMEARQNNGRANDENREYNDGILWFTEVGPSSSGASADFRHLVGNVAEMCYEDGKVFVIGGSALSPPTRPIDQPFEIPNWRSGNKGYSDVGFRLAFSAPPNPMQLLAGLIEKQPYLTP